MCAIFLLLTQFFVLNFQMNSTDRYSNNSVWCEFQVLANMSRIELNSKPMQNLENNTLIKFTIVNAL